MIFVQIPYRYYLVVFLIFGTPALQAKNSHPLIDSLPWQLKKSTPEIQVFAAKVPQSAHRAVLSTTTVNTNIYQVAKVIRNVNNCSQWVYRCQTSYHYQRLNEQEDYIYTRSQLPFPLQSRDILAHIKWEQDPSSQIIMATGIATTNILDKTPNITRIEQAKMIWELTPLSDGRTYIRNFAHINPAGAIPDWLSNSLAINAPYQTMAGLRQLLGENNTVIEDEEN